MAPRFAMLLIRRTLYMIENGLIFCSHDWFSLVAIPGTAHRGNTTASAHPARTLG